MDEKNIGLKEDIKIHQLFKIVADNNASDLHLNVGAPPTLRIDGSMKALEFGRLSLDDIRKIVYQILTDNQKSKFETNLTLDFSFGIKNLARFRGNVYSSKGKMAATFRLIPSIIPDFKSLNLPNVLLSMTDANNGLVLVTGPTGSGKSTTLASLIDRLNSTISGHIITLEDPIEFIHNHKNCIVSQRELGTDLTSFASGIKGLLRQDPNIILIGELRDPETIEAALTIAETGHLVFGTLHTNSCDQTINRIINVFPSQQQDQIRTLLSFVLQGVVSQKLLKKKDGKGRALAMEVMKPTSAIRNLIREKKIHQIYSQMQIGQDKTGMITMNQHLSKMVQIGILDIESAMSHTSKPEELAQMLGVNHNHE